MSSSPAVPPGSPGEGGRLAAPNRPGRRWRELALVGLCVAIIGVVVGFAVNASGSRPTSSAPPTVATVASDVPEPAPMPTPVTPSAGVTPSPRATPQRVVARMPRVDEAWVTSMSAKTGIPARALAAYAGAELEARQSHPRCGLRWNTLAGIGYVESAHGTLGGAHIMADGTTDRPVLGPRLNGGPSMAAIRDTDGGRLDGDTEWDRAVGPMQFIPSSWELFGIDANGDGVADPNNIDDAVLAAARHLCASGPMTTPAGWRRAVLDYNNSPDYANAVARQANGYADRSNQAR